MQHSTGYRDCVLTVDWSLIDQTALEAMQLNGIPAEILAEIAIDHIANGGPVVLDDATCAKLHEAAYEAIQNIAEADETEDAPVSSGHPDQINHLVTQVMPAVTRLMAGFYPQMRDILVPNVGGEYPVVLQEPFGHNGYRIQTEHTGIGATQTVHAGGEALQIHQPFSDRRSTVAPNTPAHPADEQRALLAMG